MRPFPPIDTEFADTFFRKRLEVTLAEEQMVAEKVLAAIATYRRMAPEARAQDLAYSRDLHLHVQKSRLALEEIITNREGLPLAYEKDCITEVTAIFDSIRKEHAVAGKDDFVALAIAYSTSTLVYALLWFPYTPAIDDVGNLPMREHILDHLYTIYFLAQSSAHTSFPRGSMQALAQGIALLYRILDRDVRYLKQKNLILPKASSLEIKLALGKRYYQWWRSLIKSKNTNTTQA